LKSLEDCFVGNIRAQLKRGWNQVPTWILVWWKGRWCLTRAGAAVLWTQPGAPPFLFLFIC